MFMANAEKIFAVEKNWRTGKNVSKTSPEGNAEVAVFLRCLAHLKKCHEILSQLLPVFQKNGSNITAQQLIFQLFRLVFFFMYRPEWTNRKHPELF